MVLIQYLVQLHPLEAALVVVMVLYVAVVMPVLAHKPEPKVVTVFGDKLYVEALAALAVMVTVCGKATIAGDVAVPLLPSLTITGVCAVTSAVLTVCAST